MKLFVFNLLLLGSFYLPVYAENVNIKSIQPEKTINDQKISQQHTEQQKAAAIDVQEVSSHVALAPTLIQKISNIHDLSTQASQVFLRLDKNLDVIDAAGQTRFPLQSYLGNASRRTIPVLGIQDVATLKALKILSKTHDISDITLLSHHVDLLRQAHDLIPMVWTALDLRSNTYLANNPKDLDIIVQKTNQAYARIAVIPNQYINKNNVSFLQRLLITVWADSAATTQKEAATVLISGVNGILATRSDLFHAVLKQFPQNTLLRKPFIIGHRGVPALEDENTLESARHAVHLGADIIENDIYITQDKHLVVMHDETVDRTTDGKGKIENMTLAEVKQLTTKARKRKIPTLAEYFERIKPVNNVVLMVELKSANPQLVSALKAQVEQYSFQDHLVTTSFRREQTNQVKSHLSGVSTGMLVGNMPNTGNLFSNAYQIMQDTQKYSSTYHPAYRSDLVALMGMTKHRGITFWPWALDDQTFKKLYVAGTHGITTNSAQLYSKYIVDIKTAAAVTVKSGQKFYINAELKTQDGTQFKGKANQYIVLSDSPSHQFSPKKDAITFTSKGTAYVLAGYRYQIDQQYFYHIFTGPIKVIIE
nr:glycerophosphodiester phosphodiesterase family protein [Acinetobacter sp. Marseille-Q1620]